MRNQLLHKPNNVETGNINLSDSSRPGTHWVAYAIDPHGIVYFDSYGLAPPKEFLKYVNGLIQYYQHKKITDPPICGREALAVLNAISKSSVPPHKVVHEYTVSNRH